MKKWMRLFLKKIMRMLLLLLFVSVGAFLLVSLSPVDPLQANIGQTALGALSQEQIAKLETYWGVNEPLMERYMVWAGDFLRGDMGVSLLYRQSVSSVIMQKLLNSLLLMTFAWVISGVFGFVLGVLSGMNRGRTIDKAIKCYALLTASTPAFWLALIFLLLFSVWFKLFPIGLSVPIGMEAASVRLSDRLWHAALPALTLSVTGISNIILHTREKMIDVMESEYVLFAAARGEKKWEIFKNHGFRNVLLPAITLQFASVSEIFGGSILVEQVFSYPGLGQAVVTAGLGGDTPLLLGIAVISAAIVFSGNFVADILYGAIDPRMRKGGRP
ncbi:peptide/nickel transport system permease protein [Kineothrix alysoides]|uniref:Peptide/nickel transport system permease protein n=1 Tax=Kineothrix alysoides TaxID=1469948 RepID=A0A4R1R0Y5_9FIRM|nr:ABC transporter permease [Kineothrix alysoides]TCL58938.1 peptide/nickel transport system permease protein [Kineothrix alysoides]